MIEEHVKETAKMQPCKRCGRPLKNLQSVRYEMGPVCLAKELGITPKPRQRKDPNYPKIIKDDEHVGKSTANELPKP